MTDQDKTPPIPDSFDKQTLLESVTKEVIEELKRQKVVHTQELLDIMRNLQEVTAKIEKKQTAPAPAPKKLIDRQMLHSEIDGKMEDLEIARSEFTAHCLKIMLCEDISWQDIMREIASAIPGSETETHEHLQALESLTITASDFS